MSDLVVVCCFLNRADADLAAAHLASEDIRSVIRADDGGGAYPGMNFGSIDLLVLPEDQDLAREVLDMDETQKS
ncbi:MAG: hypothetical protein OES13_02840 [Acidimicrobiia bacterium]|nr:hypothetical protein [Acidimicrobiia bacterium]